MLLPEDTPRRMGRRGAMAAGLAAVAALPVTLAAPHPARAQSAAGAGRTFVLIHGAWHGGWCWKPVRERLEALGHRVLTPSLTGLADRSHLMSRDIVLQTHIDDIVNLYRWEDLSDVTLVAHSYGGWPVSGALDAVQDRTAAVVFVDAFVPETGQAGRDLTSPRIRQILDESLAKGEAARPAPDAAVFKLARAEDAEWVNARMTPQPNGVAVTPITLTGGREAVARKVYVRGTLYPNDSFDRYAAAAETGPGWTAARLDCGHHVMLDQPDALTEIILSA